MRAVILAAGRSTRLYPHTLNRPKSLLPLWDTNILMHQIDSLKKAGIDEIVVVTGYLSDQITAILPSDIITIYYENFHKTNNLYTLEFATRLLDQDDTVVLFADVMVSHVTIKRLVECKKSSCLIIDTAFVRKDTMRVLIEEDRLIDVGSHISDTTGHGNFIGIAYYSRVIFDKLKHLMQDKVVSENSVDGYYTEAVRDLIKTEEYPSYIDIDGEPWSEIDTYDDYLKLKSLPKDLFC